MDTKIMVASAEMEGKDLAHLLIKDSPHTPFIYSFLSLQEEYRRGTKRNLANASIFLLVRPFGRVAVVGKKSPDRQRSFYLAWEGELAELTEYLDTRSVPKTATFALRSFLKGKCIVVEDIHHENVKKLAGVFSYYEPTFDGIVSAFKSVGIDDIYGILGTTA